MLKYSPEHMHCLANIYGALAPPNTGILAVQSTAANQKVWFTQPLCAHTRPACSHGVLFASNDRALYCSSA